MTRPESDRPPLIRRPEHRPKGLRLRLLALAAVLALAVLLSCLADRLG